MMVNFSPLSTKDNGDDDNGGGGDSDAGYKKNQDNHDHVHLLEFGQRLEPLRRFYGDNVITITTKSTSSHIRVLLIITLSLQLMKKMKVQVII